MLAHHLHSANPSHVAAARYVVKYLKGYKFLVITLTTKQSNDISAFLNFPFLPNKLCALADTKWGPQDASDTDPSSPPEQLDLFKSRLVLGYIIWINVPLHWISKSQSITSQSSTDSVIYATDECVKILNHITNILEEMDFKE